MTKKGRWLLKAESVEGPHSKQNYVMPRHEASMVLLRTSKRLLAHPDLVWSVRCMVHFVTPSPVGSAMEMFMGIPFRACS